MAGSCSCSQAAAQGWGRAAVWCDVFGSGSVVFEPMWWLEPEMMHHLDQTLISHLQVWAMEGEKKLIQASKYPEIFHFTNERKVIWKIFNNAWWNHSCPAQNTGVIVIISVISVPWHGFWTFTSVINQQSNGWIHCYHTSILLNLSPYSHMHLPLLFQFLTTVLLCWLSGM